MFLERLSFAVPCLVSLGPVVPWFPWSLVCVCWPPSDTVAPGPVVLWSCGSWSRRSRTWTSWTWCSWTQSLWTQSWWTRRSRVCLPTLDLEALSYGPVIPWSHGSVVHGPGACGHGARGPLQGVPLTSLIMSPLNEPDNEPCLSDLVYKQLFRVILQWWTCINIPFHIISDRCTHSAWSPHFSQALLADTEPLA